MNVGVEAARHEDPFKPAAGRGRNSERSVEERVHVGTVAASPGFAIEADVGVVSSNENGSLPEVVGGTAYEVEGEVNGDRGAASFGEFTAA